MATTESKKYILKWYDDGRSHQWFLRGLNDASGAFYGELIRHSAPRAALRLNGVVSPEDVALLRNEIAILRKNALSGSHEGWRGLFAEGLVSNPSMVYRYPCGTAEDAAFLRIIEVLGPYIRPFVECLDEKR